MKYKPVGANILVEEIVEEQKGIINPVKHDIIRGTVREIGDGTLPNGKNIPMQVHPGMTIWFQSGFGTTLPFNENLYVLPHSDILIIEED